ncbi:Nse4 C-terminal-domain-containing protein [Xylariales sp. PMI_506]|nr:Nse4 C-terminal-domain-containing protein [Xylariales sp. PMI_506]
MRDKRNKLPDGTAKRKRVLNNERERESSRRRTREPSSDRSADGDASEQYDPDQPMEERRAVQRGLRDLLKDLNENTDEYLQADSEGLHDMLRRANALSAGVKQTAEATIDSKLLVNTVDASYRRTIRLTSGNVAQGLDPDEFVSKCISYMRLGAGVSQDDAVELSSTQQQRRRRNRGRGLADGYGEDDEEPDDEGDPYNWEHLGRFACMPNIRRPATTGFLLGPLSVEKKIRKLAKRSAPFRPNNLREVRPEVLDAKDIKKNEENDLAAICTKILKRLEQVQEEAQDLAEEAFDRGGDEAGYRVMQQYGLRQTGGIDYFKFVINPKSFGQSVENMFYVSFLIRDAKISLEFDDNGFPSLSPVRSQDREATSGRHASQKQQAIFHLDPAQHRAIVEAFEISESIIEHRKAKTSENLGAREWFN